MDVSFYNFLNPSLGPFIIVDGSKFLETEFKKSKYKTKNLPKYQASNVVPFKYSN